MPSEILTTLTTLAGSAIGALGGIFLNTKLTNYRIEQLEKRVEKHNNLIERVYRLEQNEAVTAEKIAVANHRIDDLEQSDKSD